MRHSKINSIYNLPGYMVLFALLVGTISILIFQAKDSLEKGFCLLFIIYFASLLIKKYPLKHLIIGSVLIVSIMLFQLRVTSQNEMIVYPDEVKLQDNWFSSQTKNFLLSGNANSQFQQALKTKQVLVLKNVKGDIQKIMPATNYGEFDYRNYYASKNTFKQIKIKNYQVNVRKYNFLELPHLWRLKLQEEFNKFPPLLHFFQVS